MIITKSYVFSDLDIRLLVAKEIEKDFKLNFVSVNDIKIYEDTIEQKPITIEAKFESKIEVSVEE